MARGAGAGAGAGEARRAHKSIVHISAAINNSFADRYRERPARKVRNPSSTRPLVSHRPRSTSPPDFLTLIREPPALSSVWPQIYS